jgi:hypothetical protein
MDPDDGAAPAGMALAAALVARRPAIVRAARLSDKLRAPQKPWPEAV